ncbi:histidine phosphatase family protein [Paracoccus marcusii]|uniref:histidine phosphatase family protein n=1 Tax=Paracoccus marcusii TaxID=59779 RepID=UPI002ED5E3E4|nr:histidine phosphatase family protein [Paracoccus marcusii]
MPADCGDSAAFARQAARLRPAQVIASPALRCRQTATALGLVADRLEPALWEQDLGAWEGWTRRACPTLVPCPRCLGPPPPDGGESFDNMAARVIPVLQALQRDTVIVAHAGTVRAALSMVVGPAALSFAVAPLSLTVLQRAGADWAVQTVNLCAGD